VTQTQHILAVDDDEATRELIAEYLSNNDFRVSTAVNGEEMHQRLAEEVIDLIVLDLKLPGEDGFSLARNLRATSDIPIIMLTGQRDEIDRVLGLELGADDYLTKPFSPRELMARIKAVLRRFKTPETPPPSVEEKLRAYRFAGWELDLRTRRLRDPAGEPLTLTRGEYNLLRTFLRAPNRVLSRDQLIELSRGYDDEVFDRSIDVQILRLRRKLETDSREPKLIRTERGVGYIFSTDVETV
jgi:DNA-binding response OmpR family regulator